MATNSKSVQHQPALKGKASVYKSLFSPWPYFAPDEIEAAVAVLQSGNVNYWTGEEGRLFEKEFAELNGCKHAILVSNGSVALEGALRALGVGSGDEVITSSRTFIASASCAVAVGAQPVMADVDRHSQNITADSIRKVLSSRTKAVIPVHLAGWPCEMDAILELAAEHGLKVVEDCAQAHGATYKGRPVGSMGDVAAFSFCQDKIMTTAGEGGMVTTNSDDLWQKMWAYKDHGKSYDAVYRKQHAPGYRWLHESFGTNWRMTEVQSAIGRVVLRKLPEWLMIRRRHAEILTERLARIPALRVTVPPPHIGHAYYKYYVFVRPELLLPEWSRDRIMQSINAEGVPCSVGSCSEIYREKAFSGDWPEDKRLPVAKELGDSSLMFLVHPTLTPNDIQHTCSVIEHVMGQAAQPVKSGDVLNSTVTSMHR